MRLDIEMPNSGRDGDENPGICCSGVSDTFNQTTRKTNLLICAFLGRGRVFACLFANSEGAVIFSVNSSGQPIELMAAGIFTGIDTVGRPLAPKERPRIEGARSRENGGWNWLPPWKSADKDQKVKSWQV